MPDRGADRNRPGGSSSHRVEQIWRPGSRATRTRPLGVAYAGAHARAFWVGRERRRAVWARAPDSEGVTGAHVPRPAGGCNETCDRPGAVVCERLRACAVSASSSIPRGSVATWRLSVAMRRPSVATGGPSVVIWTRRFVMGWLRTRPRRPSTGLGLPRARIARRRQKTGGPPGPIAVLLRSIARRPRAIATTRDPSPSDDR